MHEEVLTLCLDKMSIDAFVVRSASSSETTLSASVETNNQKKIKTVDCNSGADDVDVDVSSRLSVVPFTNEIVKNTIQNVLQQQQQQINNEKMGFSFRLLTGSTDDDDIVVMTRLIHGLAENVNEPDAVQMTPEQYKLDGGFATTTTTATNSDPLFYCLVAEVDTVVKESCYDDGDHDETNNNTTKQRHACGYAFFYFGYELGVGRFLYLEDLYFEPQYRGLGGGTKMMCVLAQICQSLQCHHMYWQALDWNTRAIQFYSTCIGASVLHGVKTSRYCDEALEAFASDGFC
jgi:GNAT superfamily N-acetyltransferase